MSFCLNGTRFACGFCGKMGDFSENGVLGVPIFGALCPHPIFQKPLCAVCALKVSLTAEARESDLGPLSTLMSRQASSIETNTIMIGKRETGLTRVLFMILKMNG